MKAMRQGAAGGVTKFIIFGFLMMAVGGMVLMDVGGFFRSGGVGSSDVAKVAGEKISLPSFDRSLRRQLSQLGIGPQEAYRAGFVEQMVGSEIRTRLMAKAGHDLGIVIDDKRVARQIKDMLGPMVQPGQDPRDVLKQILMNQGMSEGELARAISQEILIGLINQTVQGGFTSVPDELAADLYAFEGETRDVVFVAYPDSELTSIVEPGDEQLRSLYESLKEVAYATPETRQLKLVRLKTESLKKTIQIDEQEIRDAYDDSIDLYTEKEQRTLEQSIFDSEEQANKVAEKVKAGTGLKSATKSVTGRETDYLGEKSFELESIPPEIKEMVLAVEKAGSILGPLKTAIGWQVIVVRKISDTQTKSYESVKKEIRDEILENKLIDEQYALAGTVEDMLAGGAPLDEVKQTVDIEIIDLPSVNQYGQDKSGNDALKNHEQAKTFIMENGFAVGEGETSSMTELPDGTFAAVHVDSISPKTYKPFEDVKAEMLKKWMTDQRRLENKIQANEMLESIKKNNVSAADFAKQKGKTLQTRNDVSRKAQPPKPFDQRSWANLFEAPVGEPFILDIEGGTSIAWVINADLPKTVKTDSAEFKEFKQRLVGATQNEALLMYGEDKRLEYGAAVNTKLLERAYGQSPDELN
jgi:peptidyl-prolyl cis-trans isomerase D